MTTEHDAARPFSLRLAPQIRKQLDRFAAEHGITISAAMSLLIVEALDYRKRTTQVR